MSEVPEEEVDMDNDFASDEEEVESENEYEEELYEDDENTGKVETVEEFVPDLSDVEDCKCCLVCKNSLSRF